MQALLKAQLRRIYLERRRALTDADAAQKSAAIVALLRNRDVLAAAPACLSYVASKDHEVDTKPLIVALLAAGKDIFVPWTRSDRTMGWSRIGALNELAIARFGILEPREPREAPAPPKTAPVLVPGIAFALTGHRIGYGGGFFDRFLAQHRGTSIGLAFDIQITDRIQPEEHDVAVDVIATESGIHECRRQIGCPE